jgi:gliding motility-associated-like protein
MRKFLLFISLIVLVLPFIQRARAQSNQTVKNGASTSAVNFPASGCVYQWTNDNSGIGLPASGIGNIPAFTAVNTGNAPITATITAKAVPNDFAYISNHVGNYVSVVSTATNTIVKAIPVGSAPVGVVVSPDGTRVYVANTNSNNVSVIDTKSNVVTGTVTVGKQPTQLTISPDGKLLYVINLGANSISVVNTITNAVTGVIPVSVAPYDLAISPDGSRLYVTYGTMNAIVPLSNTPAYWSPVVSVINTASNKIETNITLNESVTSLLVSTDGSRVFLANVDFGISVINTATNKEMPPMIGAGNNTLVNAGSIAQSPNGRVYAAYEGGQSVIADFDPATNKLVDTIKLLGFGAYGIGVTPDGSKLYVTGFIFSQVTVVDPVTHAIGPVILAGGNPASFKNFITGAAACDGPPVKFTITVTPTALQPPLITTGALNGSISACVGNPSVNPSLQSFSVTGTNLTGNITANAPNGFEVSLNPDNGFGNSVAITKSGNAVNNVLVYVRSAASDTAGNMSGDVLLTSGGAANQTVAVNGVVNMLPVLAPIPNQKVNNGDTANTVKLPAGASAYTWTNNNSSIGLAAAGAGNIPSFKAINTGTEPVTATVTVFPVPTPLAYIPTENSSSVSVINTVDNTVVTTVNVGDVPTAVIISPDGSKAYVLNAGSSTVSVINTLTNLVAATIPISNYGAQGLAITPDGSRLFVIVGGAGNTGSCYIMVINTNTNAVITTIPIDTYPIALVMGPDGSRAYIAINNGDGSMNQTIAVVDTKTYKVIDHITVGRFADGIAINSAGDRLYAANAISGTISVVSTVTDKVIATIPVGQDPIAVTVTPDGSMVYVGNTGFGFYGGPSTASSVSVISTLSNSVVASIPIGQYPDGLSVTPDGQNVYVISSGPGSVSTISTSTNQVTGTLPGTGYSQVYGNFISPGIACGGTPVQFTITVYPSPTALPAIVVPNTFTPNADGINDTWNIKYLDLYKSCNVNVFNRWGQPVFSSIGYGKPWNGVYNGIALPTGTYYYVIDLKNNSKILSGFVAIIR